MKRNIFRILIELTTLIFLASTPLKLSAEPLMQPRLKKVVFMNQHLEINVESAVSQKERERGLMHRNQLGEKQGMLFVYPKPAPRHVWMKNTLIPLDVLFLAADGRILSVLENLQPCRKDPCPIYNSRVPAMYMLELNSHFFSKNHLKIGQKLRLF